MGHSPRTAMLLSAKDSGAWIALVDAMGTLEAVGGASPLPAGAGIPDHVPTAAREEVARAIRRALGDGSHARLDIEVELPQGRRVYDADISPLGEHALLIGVDVTERRREEERLRHSERIMRDTEGISHLGTWYWDVSEPRAHWSAELYAIYGLDPAAHVPTYDDYLTRVHPDDRERVKAATEAVFTELRPYSHDERIRHTDGTWRDLHTWARPILDEDGHLKALLGVCQDITDRKRAEVARAASEARYRAVFDRAGHALALVDARGRIVSANRTLQDWTKRGGDDMLGTPLDSLIAPTDHDAIASALEARLGATQHDVHLDGRAVRLTLAPLGNEETLAVLEDLDAAHKDERITALQEEAAWRKRILQVASHELKNPLTPVLLDLHTLKRSARLDPGPAAVLERVDAQVSRLARMVHEFLDTARVERGQIVLDRTTWSLDDLVDAVREELAPSAGTIRLVREGSAGDVNGDRERMRQVLVNLVQNALRFSPPDGKITVRLAPVGSGPAAGARVDVVDEGPGIRGDDMPRLFRPFGTLPAGEGGSRTGLGLYISRALVEAHGGRIGALPGPPGHLWCEWGTS